MDRRVLCIGLDCASPELLLDRWKDKLPVLRGLCEGGTYGPLHSVHPPITVPAWASMLTGRDPGELGIYGFRSRQGRGYAPGPLHDARSLRADAIWDHVGRDGGGSVVVGFPPSYPARPISGAMVTGMLTPSGASPFTWPPSLSEEIRRWVGSYAFDAEAHRTGEVDALVEQVTEMTRKRFRVMRELLRRESWRFAFVHEIGLDRLQHALWSGLDDPEGDACRSLLAYHRLLDDEIGELLEVVPEGTVVLVASDHGARRFEGSFALNEWLLREGYLVLRRAPERGSGLSSAEVDWGRSRAWAQGGYCGRVYLNVRGREPEGCVAWDAARALREEIREALERLPGPDGQPLGNAVYLPEEVYVRCATPAPDLLVYAGDLRFRCAGTLGHPEVFLCENDTGPDRANHSWEGTFVLKDPEREGRGYSEGAHLLDVMPTLLERLGLPRSGVRAGRLP